MGFEKAKSVSDLAPTCPEPTSQRPTIELGWIIAGRLEDLDREAVIAARDSVLELLERACPEFRWEMPILRRDELTSELREEPVMLLESGVIERNIRHWDYTILVTGADLVSHYQPDALAVVSRAMEGVVISTSRIDPRTSDVEASREHRVRVMTQRIRTLAMHGLGHLAGLDHHSSPDNYLFEFKTAPDLDRANHLTPEQMEALHEEFRRTGDSRLEEHDSPRPRRTAWFYLRAGWLNRAEIFDAIMEAKPWQFPFRLSRLTTAATSAMLILLVTAEAWDLGMNQSGWSVSLLSVGSLILTTGYILVRQQLLLRREHPRLSEQTVVTNVSTVAIVGLGMLTTYVSLVALTLFMGLAFFSASIVKSWAVTVERTVGFGHYFLFSGFVASLGISIGALGASFERQHYFRHITFVDEEI